MREWLLSLPCVVRGEVIVDVRGPWPIMIKGIAAAVVRTKDDVINYVIQYVD
jgi:hypothetical protein